MHFTTWRTSNTCILIDESNTVIVHILRGRGQGLNMGLQSAETCKARRAKVLQEVEHLLLFPRKLQSCFNKVCT